MFEFILPVIGAVASSLISSGGQKQANQANVQQAENTNEFNAEQAAIAREFNSGEAQISREWSAQQASLGMDFSHNEATRAMDYSTMMSNTSYQRAVQDMAAAGLNPMLAYHQGGAASPQGAMGNAMMGQSSAASGPSASGVTARVENAAPALNGALAAMKTAAEIDKIQAETETEKERPKDVREGAEVKRLTQFEIREKTQQIMREGELTDAQSKLVKEKVLQLMEYGRETGAAEVYLAKLEMLVKTAKSEEEVNEAIAQAAAWAKFPGRAYVRDAAGIGSSASGLTRALGNMRNLGR